MISHHHRCIFIHIPRTGGSSLEALIWPGARSESDLWMGFIDAYRNKYQTGGLQHLLARHIRQEVGDDAFNSYFKFTVVRNPFDRAVSQFAYMRARPDLREFIGMGVDDGFGRYLGLIARDRHVQWEEQVTFLTDLDGTPLVDYVARFEHLHVDAAVILKRLGISQPLPHLNRSRHQDYRAYYGPDERAALEVIYARDLAEFGYTFGA